MSDIKGVVAEMNTITTELKKLRMNTMKLNKRKKELEEQITEYLKAKDQPGLKYNNVAIIAEEKDIRNRKKQKDKLENGQAVLREYGIDNAEEVLKEVLEGMKGSPATVTKLKVKQIKK